ncbi:hypothetical protein QBC47DRAFT_308968 [Echria macrotheca]|uniref:Uncharacterized protein n=1 Tax=Echria macrotheca TaxID=438768 RepID=A0AAJ0B530_9PEZI|nr:hypothetical protein QBC47DRAFT_308968 [Echria macrotheca]
MGSVGRFDEGTDFGFAGNRGYSYSIKGGPPPRRPPREFMDSQFETAPAVQEPPPRNPNRIALRTANYRPASSLYSPYSPPSPDHPVNLASKYGQRHGVGEISPPSSPELDPAPARRHNNGDVSPIEDDAEHRRYDFASSRNTRPGRTTPLGDRPPSQNQNRAGTNIPMMRRMRRKASDAAMREAHSKERLPASQQPNQSTPDGPRWDPLTGERTASPGGRPSQVKPAEFANGLGISSRSPPQQKTAVPTTFGDRVRRIAKNVGTRDVDPTDPAAGAFSSSRPGWRGASGRTALVDPVHDNPEVAPLKIPDKSSRRVVSPTSASAPKSGLMGGFLRRGQTPPVSPGPETASGPTPQDTIRKVVPSSQLSPAGTQTQGQSDPNYPNSPVSPNTPSAPDRAVKELTRDVLTSINANASPASLSASPRDKSSTIRRKPPANAGHQQQESVSSVYSQQTDAPPAPPAHNPNASTIVPSDRWVQPPSRFSVTTYATSADGTPRESLDDFAHNAPPMPDMPSEFQGSPQAKQESVMDRRRPKLDTRESNRGSNSDAPIVISLKDQFAPARYGRESQAAHDRRAAGMGVPSNPAVTRARTTVERPTSSSSINKMLPPVPPETSAGEARDRVGLLNAQLQALANRRININRSIKQMTELMPTDNILDSWDVIRKREDEKRKVEVLKQELAEVQREEYELGLKLHRAYKRLDRDADWEPTTLWVRRVTG